jgi:hypothetical protein
MQIVQSVLLEGGQQMSHSHINKYYSPCKQHPLKKRKCPDDRVCTIHPGSPYTVPVNSKSTLESEEEQ